MGRTADFTDEPLGAGVADRAGETIHPRLAVEFVAQVFDVHGATFPSEKDADGCRIELIDRLAEVFLRFQGHYPAALQIRLAFGKAVAAVLCVSR